MRLYVGLKCSNIYDWQPQVDKQLHDTIAFARLQYDTNNGLCFKTLEIVIALSVSSKALNVYRFQLM